MVTVRVTKQDDVQWQETTHWQSVLEADNGDRLALARRTIQEAQKAQQYKWTYDQDKIGPPKVCGGPIYLRERGGHGCRS